MAVEIDEVFSSLSEWMSWADSNRFVYNSQYGMQIGLRIKENGLVEPLSKKKALGLEVSVDTDNLRESIVFGYLNSRMRAVALVIEEKLADIGILDSKIYAPEAVTGFALFLRGIYPKFIGSEYEPSQEKQRNLYPILHLDLMSLNLETDVFDIVTTNEVLEHVPSIDEALSQIARVLKPGGWHVGTHPFAFMSDEGDIRSVLIDGAVVNLKSPEWHGNPVDPSGGSLVFETPGWNIIERAKRAGFKEAHMRFLSSEKFGIVTENTGVFVFCCQK